MPINMKDLDKKAYIGSDTNQIKNLLLDFLFREGESRHKF